MGKVLEEQYVGRLAPSPTGALHAGNVRTFLVAWLRARSLGGKVILRIDDLDHPRDKPGAAEEALRDLEWLGFDWDETLIQSQRKDIYREALETLREKSLAYPCVCSRKDVESAQSAPHEGEQLRYPGTCRGRFRSWRDAYAFSGRPPCWRFRAPGDATISFEDAFAGEYSQNVAEKMGDFPLARDEYGAGYTLASVADDILSGVTEVVRADDLLPATPAQILVERALSGSPRFRANREIRFCHVPLVVGPDGKRLAKRHGDSRISPLRLAGKDPREVIGLLASSCGWCKPGEHPALRELAGAFTLDSIPHRPFTLQRP